ncbi:MAG TPA: hypothetical protein VGE41_00175, partial [Verrucomicrobiae bacterium]
TDADLLAFLDPSQHAAKIMSKLSDRCGFHVTQRCYTLNCLSSSGSIAFQFRGFRFAWRRATPAHPQSKTTGATSTQRHAFFVNFNPKLLDQFFIPD